MSMRRAGKVSVLVAVLLVGAAAGKAQAARKHAHSSNGSTVTGMVRSIVENKSVNSSVWVPFRNRTGRRRRSGFKSSPRVKARIRVSARGKEHRKAP